MSDDEIETLAIKHIAPHYGRFERAFALGVPYHQTEQFSRVKALTEEIECRTLERAIDALKALHAKDGEWTYPHEEAIRALMENK